MIELRHITENNFKEIINMKMPEDQHFVAPNVYSLAQAWLYQPKARPFSIYNDDELVGFIMLEWDESERTLGIWRLMIALDKQGKGYGQEAIRKVIDMARREQKFDNIQLDYVEKNKVAEHVYYKLGFQHTGEVDDGEIIMKLVL